MICIKSWSSKCHKVTPVPQTLSSSLVIAAETSGPMSDIAKQRQADRRIEFWLRAFVAFILALAVVTLYYVVRHN